MDAVDVAYALYLLEKCMSKVISECFGALRHCAMLRREAQCLDLTWCRGYAKV